MKTYEVPLVLLLLLLGAACSSSGSNKNQPSSLVASAIATSVASPAVTPFSPPAGSATSIPSSQIAGQAGITAIVFINPSRGWLARGVTGHGELLVTDDGGTSWRKQYTTEFAPRLIQFMDANNGWLAGCAVPVGLSNDCEMQLLATRDGGNTWTPAASAPLTQAKVVAIGFVSPQDGWVLGAPAQLRSTHDGGTTWESLPVVGMTAPVSLQRLDANIGWVLTKDNVFATRDGGVTWTTAENPCTALQPIVVLPGQMSFADAHVGWIGCDVPIGAGMTAGALYRSSDGGATWNLVASTPKPSEPLPAGVGTFPAGVEDLDFLNEQDGWFTCGCARSGVWRTRNGGRDWNFVDVGLDGISRMLFVDDMDAWAWGFGPPLRTTDGGAHWQKADLPP